MKVRILWCWNLSLCLRWASGSSSLSSQQRSHSGVWQRTTNLLRGLCLYNSAFDYIFYILKPTQSMDCYPPGLPSWIEADSFGYPIAKHGPMLKGDWPFRTGRDTQSTIPCVLPVMKFHMKGKAACKSGQKLLNWNKGFTAKVGQKVRGTTGHV